MARPRVHDLDALLDHARRLWVQGGPGRVTTRELSAVSGMSNGAIYHAFGSRDGLLVQVWSRQAEEFLRFQRDATEQVLTAGGDARDAVVRAALSPADYALRDEQGARLLLAVTPHTLATDRLGDDDRRRLHHLRDEVGALVHELAMRLTGGTSREAVALVRHCVVDLPGVLLLKPARPTDPLARHALEHAVRGILTSPHLTEPPR